MSRTNDLGREGEKWVVEHLNLWISQPDIAGGAIRARSKGSLDIGDIEGVDLTMIECKNAKASISTLIENARWKAGNAKRPVWWLTKKKPRFTKSRAGHWYALTDLPGLIDGLKLDLSDDELDELQFPSEYTYIIKDIGDYSEFGKRYDPPNYQWKVMLVGDGRAQNHYAAIDDIKDWLDDEELDEIAEEEGTDRIIPIAIVRKPGAEFLDDWYCITTVHNMCRILESMSLRPQNEEEYDEKSEYYWRNFREEQTRFPEWEIFNIEHSTDTEKEFDKEIDEAVDDYEEELERLEEEEKENEQ